MPSSQPTCTWGSTGCTLFVLNGTTIDIYLLSGPGWGGGGEGVGKCLPPDLHVHVHGGALDVLCLY